jgi:tRNA-Thr(GGU) m(6)t(6)A37 methyltransferase TsaA
MEKYEVIPIGKIYTPFKERYQVPRQTIYSSGAEGKIEIYQQYLEGLKGIELYKHIIILFYFDQIEGYSLKARPPGSVSSRGVFATRSPYRPNHIGLSIVRLTSIDKGLLKVRDVDMLNGTPVIDIKPYVVKLDKIQ